MIRLSMPGAWRAQLRLSPTAQHRAGFTLLEVLVAIVILSVGLLGLSAMTIATIRGLDFSEDVTVATNLAQEKMEQIKNDAYADVAQGHYPVEDYNAIPGFRQFRREVEIRIDDVLANTKTAIVSVSWRRAKGGQPHNVTIQTIMSR